MAKMMTLFVLLNVCIALVAYRSSTYLQADDIGMNNVFSKITSTSVGVLDDVLTRSTTQTRSMMAWLNASKNSTIVLTKYCATALYDRLNHARTNFINSAKTSISNVCDWLDGTTDSVISFAQDYVTAVHDRVTGCLDGVTESQLGIWFMRNDPFKGRGTAERCVIHLAAIMAIVACTIKVIIVETARLRYTPPKADDYQAYCRKIEALLSESEPSTKQNRVIPHHGLNKHQSRGIIDLSNKHLKNVVVRHQRKEREMKKRKSRSLTSVLSVICGL